MKKIENYSELWQKKRNELPVNGDPNSDWLQMQSALDNLMPTSGLIKKPYHPGRLKLLYKLFIAVSATVSIYAGVKLMSGKQNDQSRNVSVKENRMVLPVTAHPLAPLNSANKSNGNKQVTKTGVINLIHTGTWHTKPAAGAILPQRQNLGNVRADSVTKHPEYVKNDESVHRDTVFLPLSQTLPRFGIDSVSHINKQLTPVNLNNNSIQKTRSDSTKQVKKKRSKIGVFL